MNCSADENNNMPNREVDLNDNSNENDSMADMNNNIPTKDLNNNKPATQQAMFDDGENNVDENESFQNDIIYEDMNDASVNTPASKTRSPLVSSVFKVKAKKNKEVAELFDNSMKYDVVYPDNLTFR